MVPCWCFHIFRCNQRQVCRLTSASVAFEGRSGLCRLIEPENNKTGDDQGTIALPPDKVLTPIQKPDQSTTIHAHRCRIQIQTRLVRTYLNCKIRPKLVGLIWTLTHSELPGHTPTWAQLRQAELRQTLWPAKAILDRIIKGNEPFPSFLILLVLLLRKHLKNTITKNELH